MRRCTAGGGSRSFLFRDMAGGAGSYGSRMPYDPGDAMGVLIHVACVMLGPTPTRQFSVKKEVFLMTHQLLAYLFSRKLMYFFPAMATKLVSRIGYPAGLAGKPTFRRFQPERSSGNQLLDPPLNRHFPSRTSSEGLSTELTPLAFEVFGRCFFPR